MDRDIMEEFQRMEEEMKRMMRRLGISQGFGLEEPKPSGSTSVRRYLPEKTKDIANQGNDIADIRDMSEFRQVNESRIPKSHITETETKVIAAFELPGVDKKDIELNIGNEYIEVKTHTRQQRRQEDKEKGTYSYETSSTNFYRRMAMPLPVDAEKAEAEYKDGMLRIEIPKKEQRPRKRINIK